MAGEMDQRLYFYHRQGCHLCEDMWLQIQEMQQQRTFEVESVDVDLDAELSGRFGSLVPVLAAGNEILCNYYLDPVALRSHLDNLNSSGL
ncbi:MAG: glutaredoxin family protein [Gammaproteobacteria bacterium]|nr:glutaredoxin family protein [Gammaproteobacteria bacterium]